MKTGNDLFVIYTAQKILKRLLIMAKKGMGAVKDLDAQEFYRNLLIGVQDWGIRYPTFDKQPSPYKKGYDECLLKKVMFPQVRSGLEVRSSSNRSKSEDPRGKEKRQ
jgi:hypothetical protein